VSRLIAETLGALLRRYRIGAGLTQAALADKAGLSEQAVSMLERGSRRRPRIETILALGTALGLDPAAVDELTLAARGARRSQPSSGTSESSELVAPRQLPSTLSDFTGRSAELDALVQVLARADGPPGTVRMAAVTGMGGVGKTALAVHAAHLTATGFPDGHLYIDLRGYGPGDAITSLEALGQLLRSLGVDDRTIPDGVNEAAALYRSRLAGLRMLILLDNANEAAQVTPLLPGAPGSAVLVTSRRALTTLPGFRQITLAPLPEADSVELLSRVAGESRVSTESAAARSIARLTGHLPLAVRLIGARLAARPSWPVEYVAEQLRVEHRRLDELGTGESGVRANIAGSVEFLAASNDELDQQAAAALDLLGLPSGSDLITLTSAHLLGQSVERTEQMLERLVDLNLLESIAPGRYRMHDLILAYTRERAHQVLSEGARTDALTRVLRLYTAVAWKCQRLTHTDSHRLTLASPPPPSLPDFTDAHSAQNWLDRERPNLIEAFHQARRSPSLRGLVPELALALFGYLESRNRWSEMRTIITAGREVAGELGFERLAAWLEHDLGIPDVEHGDFELAYGHLLPSLALFRDISDSAGQARCCSSLSYVCTKLDRLDEALTWAEEALAISQQIGDITLEGISYLALGRLRSLRGDHQLARQSFDRSIALARKTENLRSLAKRHQIAGQAYDSAGHHGEAVSSLLESLEIFTQIGDGNAQAESLQALATIHLETGRYQEAIDRAEAALHLARSYTNKQREGQILIDLGRIKAATGQLAQARDLWRQAADLLHPLSPNDEAAALALLTQHGPELAPD
jgi:tetratricopeptide (TPR) repeat protein/transcriptional regulator with XRE-family HTH domain